MLCQVLKGAPPMPDVDYRILWSSISELISVMERNKHPEDFSSEESPRPTR